MFNKTANFAIKLFFSSIWKLIKKLIIITIVRKYNTERNSTLSVVKIKFLFIMNLQAHAGSKAGLIQV
jgi:hypothetical protein